MAVLFWTGESSTDFNDDDNWVDIALPTIEDAVSPVAGDSLVFDVKSDGQENLVLVQAHIPAGNLHDITILNTFTKQIQTSGNATINLDGALSIDRAACLKATSAGTLTFDFNGSPSVDTYDGEGDLYTYKALVNYGSSVITNGPTPFVDDDSRTYTTYNFGTQSFSMVNGIYPNITFTGTLWTKRIFKEHDGTTEFNSYGSVDILNFNGGQVNSEDFDIYDYDKKFYFEKELTGIGQNFKFGHTTARFKTYRSSGTGAVIFPVTGELNSQAFGDDTNNNFYTQYHKIVIENNDNAANYWKVNAGFFLECNELIINDGGRFYGPSSGTKAVSIRSVKRPTVQGDWNFRQIADGIYESVNDSTNIPVSHGGTGLQTIANGSILYGNGNGSVGVLPVGSDGQVLKLVSGLPAWVNP